MYKGYLEETSVFLEGLTRDGEKKENVNDNKVEGNYSRWIPSGLEKME